ncbi:MAG: sodium/solute symporter [Planctomycetes bacterium]|nr:sodium/solute symporter [Planctomycetota bacterium]
MPRNSSSSESSAAAAILTFALLAAPSAAQQQETAWRELPALPDPQGLAGGFCGVSGDALLFAGGANFPAPVWVHDKVWHDAVVVLPQPDGAWQRVGRLPRPLAYGMSVSVGDEVLCIGGDDEVRVHAEVFALRWDGRQLQSRDLPALPEPLANGGAARIGATVFVVGGQNGKSVRSAVARGYRIDLTAESPSWQPLPELPGGARTLPFVVAQHDGRGHRLYVFGGRHHDPTRPFELAFRRDLWEFDPGCDRWRRRADAPVPLAAGAAVPIGQSHLMVLSYADGSILAQIAAADGSERDFDHPGFPRALFGYHTITDAWTRLGTIPAHADNQVTTTAVPWRSAVVVPSGEIRPRVRTPKVWAVTVTPRPTGFGAVNMSVLVAYLLGMVGVGCYFARRNRDTDAFFRGGQRVPWWAAACSIYATMLSSLTYVALPALVFATDWLLLPGMFMILLTAPIAIRLAMPFYRRIDATSAYEYFGARFNHLVRLVSSGLFTLFHVSRMGIVMALTALALSAVTGLSPAACVLIMGSLCLVYCTLGGIEAVIWTDTIQTVVLLGGAVLCLLFVIAGVDGGLGAVFAAGAAGDKFRFVDLDFGSRSFTGLAIWVVVLGGLGQNIASYTADQSVVQRYVTTADTRAAARSIWMNGLMAIPGSLLFFLLGTSLYAFYRGHPERLDPTIQNDQVLPSFIGAELPIGLCGLMVAGIFAAAQSTVSTSMNSTATTLVTDFLRPLRACRDERGYLRAARWLTVTMGLFGTGAGLLFISPEIRSLMAGYFKVIGMFMGALGGLFLLGVTTRRGNGWGALIGLALGVSAMFATWQWTATDGYLFATIGIVVVWVSGYVASLLLPTSRRDLAGLTLHGPGDGSR